MINLLGGPQFVAEMTGRRGRVVAEEKTGNVTYELRTADSDATLEMMNMIEKVVVIVELITFVIFRTNS